jgi:hypothetical protein
LDVAKGGAVKGDIVEKRVAEGIVAEAVEAVEGVAVGVVADVDGYRSQAIEYPNEGDDAEGAADAAARDSAVMTAAAEAAAADNASAAADAAAAAAAAADSEARSRAAPEQAGPYIITMASPFQLSTCCVLILCRCTSNHSPYPSPWPGRSFPGYITGACGQILLAAS